MNAMNKDVHDDHCILISSDSEADFDEIKVISSDFDNSVSDVIPELNSSPKTTNRPKTTNHGLFARWNSNKQTLSNPIVEDNISFPKLVCPTQCSKKEFLLYRDILLHWRVCKKYQSWKQTVEIWRKEYRFSLFLPSESELWKGTLCSKLSITDLEWERYYLPSELSTNFERHDIPLAGLKRFFLTRNEQILLDFWSTLFSIQMVPYNPFNFARTSGSSMEKASFESAIKIWEKCLLLLNHSADTTVLDLWWKLCSPTGIKSLIKILTSFRFTLKTCINWFEALVKMAWLITNSDFRKFSGLPEDISDESFRFAEWKNLYSTWYQNSYPSEKKKAKKSTLERRSFENLEQNNKWIASNKLIAVIPLLDNALNDPNLPLSKLKNLAIFLFFVTGPPPRAQNLRLLWIPKGDHPSIDMISTEIINWNHSLENPQCYGVTGVIYEEKAENGYFHIIWTQYKTVKTFGIQHRYIFHDTTIKAFQKVFDQLNRSSPVFFQGKKNVNQCHKITGAVTSIAKQYLNSQIDIRSIRIITTTEVKNSGTAEQFRVFCIACLHGEDVSDAYYVKSASLNKVFLKSFSFSIVIQ